MKRAKISTKSGEFLIDVRVYEDPEGWHTYDYTGGYLNPENLDILGLKAEEYDEPALIRHESDCWINFYKTTQGYYSIAYNTYNQAQEMQRDFNDGFESFKFLRTFHQHLVYTEEVK